MAIQAKTPSFHFSHTFHSPSPMPASLSLLFGPLRSMSMASKPQRIRKSLELVTCKSNPNDNQQVWLGFHCSLTTFFFFFFFFSYRHKNWKTHLHWSGWFLDYVSGLSDWCSWVSWRWFFLQWRCYSVLFRIPICYYCFVA